MIPNQEKTVNITGSSDVNQARSQQMGLDANSLPHLMRVLTNLYSDPELAVIREYSTNAYDSHVAAGRGDVPIQVSLPTVFSPEFVVRDFGVGLSEEEVFNIFGQYGASTKRESNEFVGQLGLGCKSALTLTNQFSLTAIKDGVKCVFSVHLDETGVGSITKLHEEITDSGNGVEISIPVKEVSSFNRKAKKFYRFFPVLPEFVGGVAFPEEMRPEVLLQVTENIKVIRSVYDDDGVDYIVMGGVAYPYRDGVRKPLNAGTLVIEAPIGSVDFTPSREELHLTSRTKKFVGDSIELARSVFSNQLKGKLSSAKDFNEFSKLIVDFRYDLNSLGIKSVHYDGYDYGFSFAGPVINVLVTQFEVNNKLQSYVYDGFTDTMQSDDSVLVFGEADSSHYRGKIGKFIRQSKARRVILVPESAKSKLPDRFTKGFSRILTMKELIQEVASTTKKGETKYSLAQINNNMYRRYSRDTYSTFDFSQMEVPDEDDEFLYMLKYEAKRDPTKYANVLEFFTSEGFKVYAINKTQEDKFLECYPESRDLIDFSKEYLAQELRKALDALSEDEKLLNSKLLKGVGYEILHNNARGLPHDKIEDEELSEYIRVINLFLVSGPYTSKSPKSRLENLYSVAFTIRHESPALTKLIEECDSLGKDMAKTIKDMYNDLSKKYPLLLGRQNHKEHFIQYANLIAGKEN